MVLETMRKREQAWLSKEPLLGLGMHDKLHSYILSILDFDSVNKVAVKLASGKALISVSAIYRG